MQGVIRHHIHDTFVTIFNYFHMLPFNNRSPSPLRMITCESLIKNVIHQTVISLRLQVLHEKTIQDNDINDLLSASENFLEQG